jgi:hypothetical protein
MTFAAPIWLAVAGVVAAGVVFAHLFSSTIPPQDVLPTVRFIPESTPLTVMRSRRITDWLLLLLRVVVVLLFGLALSGAHVERQAPSNIVLVDASRAVGSMQQVIDSALKSAFPGGKFVVFDSTAREVTADEVRALKPSTARGSLSAALVVAHRLVGHAEGMDATQLVIVSPTVREEVDSAVHPLIDLWAGTIKTVRVAAAPTPTAASWEIRAAGDDPVAAALSSVPQRRANAKVRVVRSAPTPSDSQWAAAGGALVVWPQDGAGLTKRAAADSQGGIATSRDVVVAQFARAFQPGAGKAVVLWADGAPAATEHALGAGCVREVAIPVDAVGDVALRESFRGIARSLIEPCGGAPDFTDVQVPKAEWIKIGEPAPTRVIPATPVDTGKLPMWLALIAAMVLGAEQELRRRAKANA